MHIGFYRATTHYWVITILNRMNKISRLQYITTNIAMAEKACAGGVDWVQLRLKNVSYNEYRTVALQVQAVCKKYNAAFIINDNAQLALDIHADGVHIGKEDVLLPADEKELLARNAIIGCTANTVEDIMHFSGVPVSYLGLGPFRFTTTKAKLSPILGIAGYQRIFHELKEKNVKGIPPIVGIGGVMAEDIPALLSTGLHGIAVSGAISNADDITNAAKRFKSFFNYQLQ